MSNKQDLAGVLTATFFQLAVSFGCFFGFSILRPANKAVYEPKFKYAVEQKKPPPIKTFNLIGWLQVVLNTNDDDTLEKVGADAFLFLKFAEMGRNLFGIMTLFAVPLMIVNFYAPQLTSGNQISALNGTQIINLSLNALTIINVGKGNNLLYLHAGAAYVFTFLTFYMLYKSWNDFFTLKTKYFSSIEYLHSFHNRMLLFTDNPVSRRSSSSFRKYLESLHVTEVPESIQIGRDYKELPSLVERHMLLTKKFEKVLVKYLKNPAKLPSRPTHLEGTTLGIFGGQRVDSIDFYSYELKRLEQEIYALRAQSDQEFETDASCFVTFKDIKQAHAVAKRIANPIGHNYISNAIFNYPDVKPCPQFDDILWDNISVPPAVKKRRALLAAGILAALITCWIFLQTGIAALSSKLFKTKSSTSQQAAFVFLQSIITPTLNAMLNILLPVFLRKIAKLQGVFSESGVERSALYKFFVFQVYQYIIQIGSTFFFAYILNVVNGNVNSADSLQILAREISSSFVDKSTYFITFIVTGFSAFGLEIIQGYSLISAFIAKRFFSVTPRQEKELNDTPKFDFLYIYGFLLMTMLIGFSYSVIASLIVPFAAVVFALAHITFKYQLLYVYETKHETGGKWYPKIFNMVVASLIIFQLSTFGGLVVTGAQTENTGKVSGRTPNLLVSLLPAITLLFWLYCNYFLRPRCEYISSKVNTEEARYVLDTRFESDVLKGRLFNPAITQLLPKIWVHKEMKEHASILYKPDFNDVIDYVSKTNPTKQAEVQFLESERAEQRGTLERQKRHSALSDATDLTAAHANFSNSSIDSLYSVPAPNANPYANHVRYNQPTRQQQHHFPYRQQSLGTDRFS